MTHAFVIQIAGRTAGIVAGDPADHACHFFASSPAYRVLEGVAFQEPDRPSAPRGKSMAAGGAPARKEEKLPNLTALEAAPCLPNPAI